MKNKKFNADEAAKNLGYRSISEMLRLNEIPRSTMYSAIRKNATIEENEDGSGVVVLPPPKPIFEIKKKRKINKKSFAINHLVI